jgi:hypothetical protein
MKSGRQCMSKMINLIKKNKQEKREPNRNSGAEEYNDTIEKREILQ